ncbi:hypothetical protein IAQ61_006463 [Plenodomus lingam]|uniref:uncharacterized protein n=1 Tax=Leptosphaeria maculans TaxID=5022 RepID=UPI0033218F7B|nr:hypothetical protein IAQ61_006463 [Plenodomus lingam]
MQAPLLPTLFHLPILLATWPEESRSRHVLVHPYTSQQQESQTPFLRFLLCRGSRTRSSQVKSTLQQHQDQDSEQY